ncbi:hypothetical protein [Stutzerimonas stutzeri]|nr:hypothetical protein [Stutzerimonas stutzeri]
MNAAVRTPWSTGFCFAGFAPDHSPPCAILRDLHRFEGIPMSDQDHQNVTITAFITGIDCPRCSHPNTGFINDPRGGTFECSGCNEPFTVPEDAAIDFG